MYAFGYPEYAMLLGVFILCCAFVIFIRKRVKNNSDKTGLLSKSWPGLTSILVGILVIFAAVILHMLIRADIAKTMEILKPISIMTSAPAFILTIIISFIGVTLFYIGVLFLRSKPTKNNNMA